MIFIINENFYKIFLYFFIISYMQKMSKNLSAKYYQRYYWGIYQNLSKEEKEKK